MSKKEIKQLLFDLNVVNAELNNISNNIQKDTVILRMIAIRAKAVIQSKLKLYTDEEIKLAQLPDKKIRKVFIEENEVVTYEQERGFLWLMLMLYVLTDNTIKHKAFMMIAIEMCCKDLVRKVKKEEVLKIRYE